MVLGLDDNPVLVCILVLVEVAHGANLVYILVLVLHSNEDSVVDNNNKILRNIQLGTDNRDKDNRMDRLGNNNIVHQKRMDILRLVPFEAQELRRRYHLELAPTWRLPSL